MGLDELEQKLKTEELNGIYLFYGEEEYLLGNSIKKFKKSFGELMLGINYIQLDANSVDKIIPNIEIPAFGYDKKLIIVKNSNLFKKTAKNNEIIVKKIVEYLNENIDVIKQSVALIFIEEEANKNELYKIIQNGGIICNFEKMKPFQISKKIKEICNMYKVKISDSTIQEFIETCGTNMQNLINEIRKLIECVGKNGTITSKEIRDLSVKEFDAVIFDLTDSLGKKDITNALDTLHELIYNKEPIQKILITLYGHFKRLYLVSLAEKYNYNIVDALNLKPNQTFLVTKYRKQSGYFKMEELHNILKELTELDYKMKQGLLDIDVGLEAVLCTYCG